MTHNELDLNFQFPSEKMNQTSRGSANGLRSYDYFYICKMADNRHLGFLEFENCTIRSAIPENPILVRTKHGIDRVSGCEVIAIVFKMAAAAILMCFRLRFLSYGRFWMMAL